MPQHKKLSQLTLRLPEPPHDIPPALRNYLQQYTAALQNHFNAISGLDLCSGLTKFSDDQNAGYYMGFTRNDAGYDDGTPVFVVGDRGAEKYFEFDGTDLALGFNTELKGADHFNNASTYIGDVFMGGLSGYNTGTSGGGTATYDATHGYAQVSVGGTSGDLASIIKSIQYNTVGGTIKGGSTGSGGFEGLSRFKCTVGITNLSATNLDFRCGVGQSATTGGNPTVWPAGGMGIKIKNGRFYAYSISGDGPGFGQGTTETEYDTGLNASTGTFQFTIEGGSVSINDTEYVTTFATPSRCWTGNDYFHLVLQNTGASSTTTARCSQWKVN